MKTSLFDFHLPEDLIADRPAEPRDGARMLVIPSPVGGRLGGGRLVRDLPQLLRPGDVMVFNDTRVIPARLFGKRGAARVEVLLHKPVIASAAKQSNLLKKLDCFVASAPRNDEVLWHCFAKPAKKLKPGDTLVFAEDFHADVLEKSPDGQVLLAFPADLHDKLAKHGHMPLPPYITRDDDAADKDRYQTIYARHEGSVAAPTAGLHFTPALLQAIDAAGVKRVHVTLHVGGGTFLPVKAEDTKDHMMHSEYAEISVEAANAINAAKKAGGRVIAVGTTSLRALESFADENGMVQPFARETDIFITPGYRFKVVDMLLTNFHLPKSTLFMLVCAFAGTERMKAAYAHAIAEKYRFYSYGDACLLYCHPERSAKRAAEGS